MCALTPPLGPRLAVDEPAGASWGGYSSAVARPGWVAEAVAAAEERPVWRAWTARQVPWKARRAESSGK